MYNFLTRTRIAGGSLFRFAQLAKAVTERTARTSKRFLLREIIKKSCEEKNNLPQFRAFEAKELLGFHGASDISGSI